ncbi:MAG: hypothetical protein WBC92_02360 [Terracidiphilus sp.]
MKSLLESEEYQQKDERPATLGRQALWVFLHTLLALGSWLALMLAGYALHPNGVPQWAILLLSLAVPLAVGLIVTKIRPDEMATVVWLIGVIWVLVFSLYILDLPTGPGQCFQCGANEKLARAFLSLPQPSGLIDDDTPFLATWPAAALIGYSIGAKLGMRGQG